MPKKPKPTIHDVRRFRSAVAKLKRAGLVSPLIDARKASIESRGLKAAVKKFGDVVAGLAGTVKTGRLKIKAGELRERRFQIAKPAGLPQRVIVPKFPDEKVRVRAGSIDYVSQEGIRRLELPKLRTDQGVQGFLRDLKRHKIKIPDTRKGQVFAARFKSGRTTTFSSLRQLIAKLQTYDAVKAAPTKGVAFNNDILRNIEIITMPDTRDSKRAWNKAKKQDRIDNARRKEQRDTRQHWIELPKPAKPAGSRNVQKKSAKPKAAGSAKKTTSPKPKKKS